MERPLVVLKFGSSVLENRNCLSVLVHQIYRHYRRGQCVLAVVSAIGRHTEVLLAEARQWINPPGPERAVAELLATGERQSAALLTMALARAGVSAQVVSPSEIRLMLRGSRLDAWPIAVDITAIHSVLEATSVLVVPGFAGLHEAGGTALMGRGGSDLTAVYLADVLRAVECRLIKDVDGIFERDPAKSDSTLGQPRLYREVTYDDALRVSGSLVQRKAIEYLCEQGIVTQVTGLLQEAGTTLGSSASTLVDLPDRSPLKVLLLGLGQVGQGVYHHLRQLSRFFEIGGILVRDIRKSRDFPVTEGLLTTKIEELLKHPYDVLVDVSGDYSITKGPIEASLIAGRWVVTASKRLVAEHGPALTSLAAKYGSGILYSAAVGGAAPMIETLERALHDGPITRLRGVLNGTCNFVLDQVASGVTFHKAVSQARLRGFAEANVSRDLHGDDSADKLRILARLAFGAEADVVSITRESVSPTEISRLRSSDGVVRQVASFDLLTGANISLETLEANDYLAAARGEENRLIISGSQGREWRVSGKGAGRWPAAQAVIADLLDVHDRSVTSTMAARN